MRNAREWKGLLGAFLSSHLYIDFSSAFTDDAIFDAKVNELVSSNTVASMMVPVPVYRNKIIAKRMHKAH